MLKCIRCNRREYGMMPTDDGYVCITCVKEELSKLREERETIKIQLATVVSSLDYCLELNATEHEGKVNDSTHVYQWGISMSRGVIKNWQKLMCGLAVRMEAS